MKIGVLTFHRCINYGSYWQARCLAEGLRARGHDAELLDHEAPEIWRAELRNAFQPQRPRRTPREDLPRYGAKTRAFFKAFEGLPRSPSFPLDAPEQAGAYDLVVVGSDEVWNFRHPWYGNKRIFFGDGLRTERLASYAASFGNHDADHGIDSFWTDRLKKFDAISVRDRNSHRLIEDNLDEDPAIVLDPCLQFPPAKRGSGGGDYLALYGHSFPEWFAQAVRRWADREGRKIVSIGYRNDWADEQAIEAGPEEFSELMGEAAAIATNYFHGCVFALHHRRPFVCAPSDYRMNKVRDLTVEVGAERHLIAPDAPDSVFDELLGTPLDAVIEDRIVALRERSNRYLETVLG